MVDLPNVAWISARDGSRPQGDLEDQAARYHPARHELTINADFRAISDLITHWQDRYKGVPGARAVIEAQVREWCEQILVEVVLAARASTWSAEQLEALVRIVESAGEVAVARERDVDLLTSAERRGVANALARATWSAVSAKTRVLLLDLLTANDAVAIWQARR